MNTDNCNTVAYKEHNAPDLENINRADLIKEAVNIILTLDDAKLKILLERMGFCNEADSLLQSH